MKLRLKPSIREKKRYLYFKIKSVNGDAGKLIKKSILDYVGSLGYAKASPRVIKIEKKGSTYEGILSINRKEIEKIKGALVLAEIEVIKVSGTLKKLKGKKKR